MKNHFGGKARSGINFTKNVFKILRLMWQSSKSVTAASFLITTIDGLMLPAGMVVSKYLIDGVVSCLASGNAQKSVNRVLMWLLFDFLILICSQLLSQLGRYFYECQDKLLNIYTTKLLTEKINELDISYFENPEIYDKIEKANNEARSRSVGMLNTFIAIIKSVASLIGSVAIVVSLNPVIFLLCLLTTLPMFWVNVKISDKRYGVFDERIHEIRFAIHLQRMMVNFNSVKEIKLNRIGDYLKNTILSVYTKHFQQDKGIGKKYLKDMSIIDMLNNIISFAFKLYVVMNTLWKGLTIGSMAMYLSALTNTEQSIRNVLNNISNLYADNLYIENLFAVLDLKPLIHGNPELPSFNNIRKSIEFRNVSFMYPNSDKYVLKNINFEIKAGETCAIVGLNGSGKTTLIKLLARLYDPAEGAIYIDGKDIREFDVETLYKNINVVFQDFMKYPFTVKNNIGFGNIEKMDDMELVKHASEKSGASEFINKLSHNYDTKLDKMWVGGVELSLGQWQKLAISRAFMSEAPILILDEPTASLDPEAEYELFQNFKQLIGTSTCILISHRFSTVRMADKIVVIDKGCIAECGNHEALMGNGRLYAKLFNMQAQAYLANSTNCEDRGKEYSEVSDAVGSGVHGSTTVIMKDKKAI